MSGYYTSCHFCVHVRHSLACAYYGSDAAIGANIFRKSGKSWLGEKKWPAALRQCCLYIWASPTSSLGVLALLLAATRGRVRTRIVQGVLEIHGGWITLFLRHGTLLAGGASAMTLGHVVLGQCGRLLDQTRSHERVHVRQCERWGLLFVPAYLLASVVAWLRGLRPYLDNPFEREAYELDGRF